MARKESWFASGRRGAVADDVRVRAFNPDQPKHRELGQSCPSSKARPTTVPRPAFPLWTMVSGLAWIVPFGVVAVSSNINLLDLVSNPTAADWDASFAVKRIKL